MIEAVRKRRKKLRQLAIEYKNGKCAICGYDKCLMLCANCHREVHAGLQLPRETVVEKVGEFRET